MPERVFIESSPQTSITVPAQTGIGAVATVVLVANPKRKGFMVQNTGTTIIKLAFGGTTSTPNQTVYHIALKGGTGSDDATGSTYTDDAWAGDVWAISSAPGGTMVITEFTIGSPNWDLAGDWGLR